MQKKVVIVGGGLAGCEAAYQLLKRDYQVDMYEIRGVKNTPCHKTDDLAELVCSNSLKGMSKDTASGMLKAELEMLDSLLLKCAYRSAVPAGGALAVDREVFSKEVEKELFSFDGFNLIRDEIKGIAFDCKAIIATGPLTSDSLSKSIMEFTGENNLHFYDAVAPIVSADSIDYDKAFFASRYGKGDSDYLNCAMNKEEYLAFYNALINAERVELKDFEKSEIFDGCMPIEIMASRGEDTMRYGPLRPVGIRNPKDDSRSYAIVQLRKENIGGQAYNIVGFQTNLTFKEQKRVFSMINGLENAEFLRYGVMHRNTFINSPTVLNEGFQTKKNKDLYFAGQITGVEGYMESIASGLIAGINASLADGDNLFIPPMQTIIGSLCRHVANNCGDFQPMNSNFGILPPLENPPRDKKERKLKYCETGLAMLEKYIKEYNIVKHN